jgi:uncharacterized oligopeptide transporter (OPT) family protein
MQTMAASVASLAGMAVLIQAMVWLKMPMPPTLPLMVFFCCIGMFGVGLGMLYTPILVDRLKLEYPSGHAVANILRALTDKRLLKRSIGQLGSGVALGAGFGWLVEKIAVIGATGISGSTIGAGMVVASRIAVPGLVMGLIGHFIRPYLVAIEWIEPNQPFRAIGFLIALAMILGAAIVDLSLIGVEAVRRIRAQFGAQAAGDKPVGPAVPAEPAWKQVNMPRLIAWVVFWGVALVVVASVVLNQPVSFILFAVGLTLIFVFINGISTGISDSNPISSAFVVAVLLMAGLGLKDPVVGLMAASILLVACSTGVDMQQDRSTGWRLGTNRVIQFRYQVIGIVMGAVLCVGLAKLFMRQYDVLTINSFAEPTAAVGRWQSAMTYKFVGALSDLEKAELPVHKVKALFIGLAIGLVTEIARKVLHSNAKYKKLIHGSKGGFVFGWTMDAILLPSPYASSFGGFVGLPTTAWFAAGGVLTSLINTFTKKPAKVMAEEGGSAEGEAKEQMADAAGPKEHVEGDELPEDMSSTSLVGGGLIAGEALFFMALGLIGLAAVLGDLF